MDSRPVFRKVVTTGVVSPLRRASYTPYDGRRNQWTMNSEQFQSKKSTSIDISRPKSTSIDRSRHQSTEVDKSRQKSISVDKNRLRSTEVD